MLVIDVPDMEYFNETTGEVTVVKGQKLQLEHSLVSLSKWESKWEKPFLTRDEKTAEQMKDYIRCMTITQNVRPEVYDNLTSKNISDINAYINLKMTATWFAEEKRAPSREVITNEIIYYWMITLNIPVEFQKWHLNRLLTLIKVCSIKNSPKKKMSGRALAQRNSALNAQRRARRE